MKDNFIHVCFIIDESGSMNGSESDIIGGFNKTIEEQKAIKDGQCAISFYSFNDGISERFIGKDVNDVKPLVQGSRFGSHRMFNHPTHICSITSATTIDTTITEDNDDYLYQYSPGGCTAMNDAIATAINKIGKWLSEMPEEDRPSKNLIVIMTDGEENSSKEYTLAKVQEMIKHQTEKYDWTFVYMGMDISNAKAANSLGIANRSFSTKSSNHLMSNYANISNATTCYRVADSDMADLAFTASLDASLTAMTQDFEDTTGIKIN